MQHAFIAQHFWTVDLNNGTQKIFQLGRVQRFVSAENERLHVVVVGVMAGVVAVFVVNVIVCVIMIVVVMAVSASWFQKVRVDVQLGIQVEALQIKHAGQRHLAEIHCRLRGTRVHVFHAVFQRFQRRRLNQIGLAEENLVGKTNLHAGFLAVGELLLAVNGVDQGEDRVEQIAFGDLVVHEKGLRHRAGVGQAGGFDHHAVKLKLAFAFFLGQIGQRGAQVFADGAANAAVIELNDLLFAVLHQYFVVDVLGAEFVFDHRNFLPVGFGQHALEQGGFARAEKAGEDGGGNEGHGGFL